MTDERIPVIDAAFDEMDAMAKELSLELTAERP